jgi:hypothetical protein
MGCNMFPQQLQLSPGCRLATRPTGAINILLLAGIITELTVLVRQRLIQDVASHSSCKKGMTGHYRYHATLISVCRRWIHTGTHSRELSHRRHQEVCINPPHYTPKDVYCLLFMLRSHLLQVWRQFVLGRQQLRRIMLTAFFFNLPESRLVNSYIYASCKSFILPSSGSDLCSSFFLELQLMFSGEGIYKRWKLNEICSI